MKSLQSKKSVFKNVFAALAFAGAACCAFGGVYDDCEMLFLEGTDFNGNGCFDDGEMPERLHPQTSATVTRAWDFPADCITWTNMSVQCNCKSNVLENQTCLYFHQKGTQDNVLKDIACALALPRFGYTDEETNYNVTVLFRIKLPTTDTKADGTAYTGSDFSVCGTLAAVGNKRTTGQWKGIDFRISHAASNPFMNALVQKWSGGDVYTIGVCPITNATYQTRDAEWLEVAVRGYTWTYNKAPAPGGRINVWRWDGSSSAKADGGRNAAPSINEPFLLGNNADQKVVNGFQGAVHMVAAWKRELSDTECKEAFKYMAGSLDSLAHDGNNSGLYKLGYDTSDGVLFGGETGGTTTFDAADRYATYFPSNFIAGTKCTLNLALNKYTKNMKQILRIRTAASSATGRMTIKANGTTLASSQRYEPNQTYLYFLPVAFFAGDTFAVELNCTEAEAGGVRFATVETCGSWTIGLKDNSQSYIIPEVTDVKKDANNRIFRVGVDYNPCFNTYWYDYQKNGPTHSPDLSYLDIKFYVPEGLDQNFRYIFKGSVCGGDICDKEHTFEYTLNGVKKTDRFVVTSFDDKKDYSMTIESGDLSNGWNTIRHQNYFTNGVTKTGAIRWCYTYWDYVSLQLVKRTNMGLSLFLQ